jgi:hypothetical protein
MVQRNRRRDAVDSTPEACVPQRNQLRGSNDRAGFSLAIKLAEVGISLELNFFLSRSPSVRRMLVNQRRFICIGILLCGLLCGITRADTFTLNDGSTLTGDIISYSETGLRVKFPDGTYSDPVAWTKFSQDDLKKLSQNPKIAPFASAFIEETDEQRAARTEVPNPVIPTRLKRPAVHSLFSAMLSSSVGLFVIVILYGAGIYAAYEVALFRRRPRGLVCGLAAIPGLGLISPIVFMSMPPARLSVEEEETYRAETAPPAEAPSFIVPGSPEAAAAAAAAEAPAGNAGGLHIAHAAPAASGAPLPPTQVFQRGAFMFNRRFLETKFSSFFGVVRREADKDMVLIIKAARGEFTVDRISRISTNELHAQVRKGPASEEVTIPFTEIQEIRLKHKDSPN